MSAEIGDTSIDAVLGGRLQLRQPLKGHRVGHDAMLLAAATGGGAGEHAVELGAGVGAAGLALARRIDGLRVALVELDPSLVALAGGNARRNQLEDRVTALCADAENIGTLAAAGLVAGGSDCVLMNPPFRDASRQNVSPDPNRRQAHVGAPGLLPRWLAGAAWLLKPGGVLTLIWHADRWDEVMAALKSAFGDVAVLAVHPRPDKSAIRVLVRAVKGASWRVVNQPRLDLNDLRGWPSAAAEAILRGGETISLAEM